MVRTDISLLSEHDVYLFREGSHYKLHEKLGAHYLERPEYRGTYFAVWAPNAERVSVIGDFNGWNRQSHPLSARWDGSGIWEGFIDHLGPGTVYKYHIKSRVNGYEVDKADPFGFGAEVPPRTASVVRSMWYEWKDRDWMETRGRRNALDAPISVYEVHLGSWKKRLDGQAEFFDYREIAHALADYVLEMGYTHVELMPIMEHPFYASWGYQTVGYFAPTSRHGEPTDFMYFVDYLHQKGIGVILDWVPSHFPSDEHGLGYFDGTYLFEHEDINKRIHPDWNSLIFNYGRNEVRAFLISSAIYWLEKYHIDGLRVDAVASMLYLDYSRKHGEWTPNRYGGRENLEAIDFLRQFNWSVYKEFPDVQTIAEESTSWPMVSRPAYTGGLGFGMKWNMGWMHDTLDYMGRDPIHRKYHQQQLTFSIWYAFSENFVLPLSHDEVVHGKGSLINKMPGDAWQKFANLRLLLGYMFTHPGKKMLFMGGDMAQWAEWNHDRGLDWSLLEHASHQGIHKLVADLNALYQKERALHELDVEHDGFAWIDNSDSENSVMSYIRRGREGKDNLVAICNFTPAPRHNYRMGAPSGGQWTELFNTDAQQYGGSGVGNMGKVEAVPVPYYDSFDYTLVLTLPPLGMLILKPEGDAEHDRG